MNIFQVITFMVKCSICIYMYRIPCEYKKQNLAVRVEEGSQKPNHLAIKFLFQGGQTDIVGVDVAQVKTSDSHQLAFF